MKGTINMVALRILMEIKSEINVVCLITNINMANTIMDLKYCIRILSTVFSSATNWNSLR